MQHEDRSKAHASATPLSCDIEFTSITELKLLTSTYDSEDLDMAQSRVAGDGLEAPTKATCDDSTKTKWIVVTMADLLRLLQPVESSWKTLGYELLEDKLSYKIDVIESNCFHNHTYVAALDDVLKKWLDWATGTERSWQTLCDAAKKYGNNSLEKYLTENDLKKNEEPMAKHLMRWSRNSQLSTNWFNFAVELIDRNKIEIIRTAHFGGGDHACLERLLSTWWDTTIDHDWQTIVDALKKMNETRVIESIEEKCLRKK